MNILFRLNKNKDDVQGVHNLNNIPILFYLCVLWVEIRCKLKLLFSIRVAIKAERDFRIYRKREHISRGNCINFFYILPLLNLYKYCSFTSFNMFTPLKCPSVAERFDTILCLKWLYAGFTSFLKKLITTGCSMPNVFLFLVITLSAILMNSLWTSLSHVHHLSAIGHSNHLLQRVGLPF